jgi:hypothetical protein
MGFPAGAHRLPITSAEAKTRDDVRETIEALGLNGALKGLA